MLIETPPLQRDTPKAQGERRGLVMVHTGNGKGKSPAAFGLALRAPGRGVKVFLVRALHDKKAAVVYGRGIDGGPGGDAGVGFGQQVEIVLVHPLPLRARRLEIIHRLREQRVAAEQRREPRGPARVQRPGLRAPDVAVRGPLPAPGTTTP